MGFIHWSANQAGGQKAKGTANCQEPLLGTDPALEGSRTIRGEKNWNTNRWEHSLLSFYFMGPHTPGYHV